MKYQIKFIAGYWRVMKDRKIVSTHRQYREAEAAKRALVGG